MRSEGAMTIRVLITDDHKVVRRGLRGFLELDPGLEIVGEASNGEETLRLARHLEPDVVLMDLLMPVMDGIEATREIRRELPEVEVLALTTRVQYRVPAAARLHRRGAAGHQDPRPRRRRPGEHRLQPPAHPG
jgi:two-component system, NarL family, response regulator LiaR